MNLKTLIAIGLCGGLLAACSQKTEDKAAEATGTAAVAADQAGDTVQSAGGDAVVSTRAAAARTAAAVEHAANATANATAKAARKADAAADAAAKQK